MARRKPLWASLLTWSVYALAVTGSIAGCNRLEVSRPSLPPGTPNVLLVSIDTLRADHVGAYGAVDAGTPTLDALAARGVLFTDAFSVAPITLPAHTSLLTGVLPPRHGVRHNGLFVLGADRPVLAEILARAGYRTGAVVGAVVLAARYGLDRGFESYDDRSGQTRSGPGGYLERRASEATDRALSWIDRGQGPFFLWVHYYDPHQAWSPPAPFDAEFADRPYQGEIAYADSELGRLLRELENRKALEDTLVVVTSDHGESLGEHGEPTHSYTLYDAALRVPLILSGPRVPEGRRASGLASLVDVVPTVLSLLGRTPPPDVDGIDLSAHWMEASPEPRIVYAETIAGRLDHGWSDLYAARSTDHLFVRAPRPELYDLQTDRAELHNLLEKAGDADAVVAPFEAAIDRVLERSATARSLELDASTRSQLAALGYTPDAHEGPALGTDPKDGLAALREYWAAGEAFQNRDLSAARLHARHALETLPASREVHALLARIELEAGRPGPARTQAEEAIRLGPKTGRFHAIRADALAALGETQAAFEGYATAIALDPHDPGAHMGRIRLAALLNDGERVTRFETAAREHAPGNPELLLSLAFVWERLGDRERALERTEEALEIEPEFGVARMNLAIQLAALGREAEAEAALARAGDAGREPALLNRLGIAWVRSGRSERARALFRELIARYPDYMSPRRNLARLEESLSDPG